MTRQRAYQLRKLASGLCQQCGKQPLHSTTMCRQCLLKLSEAAHRRYQERKARGVCIYCGKPELASTTSCAACVSKKQSLRQRAVEGAAASVQHEEEMAFA